MEQRMRMIESAMVLYKEKPWDLFDDYEVIELTGLPFTMHVYCLFCWKHERKCIRIFHGIESFTDVSDYFKPMGNERVDLFHHFEHDFFEIVFDDPEHLDETDLKLCEMMELSSREMPVISLQRKRHFPTVPDERYQLYLEMILNGLFEAMQMVLKSENDFDFTKRRFVYDVKKKSCSSKKTAYRPRKYDVVEIDDDELMNHLSSLERIDEVWEFDLQICDSIAFASEGDLTSPVYLAALSNVLDVQMLASVPFEPFGDLQFQCIDLMVEAFMQRGLPKALVVRHPLVGSAMMDLTRKLKMDLIPVEQFEMLDDFVDGLDEFMNHSKEIN